MPKISKEIHYLSNQMYEEYQTIDGVKEGRATFVFANSNYSEIENLSISQVCNSLEKSEEMERFYYLNDEYSEESKKYGDSDEVEAVFFDTETNGVGINHSVLSISAVKVHGLDRDVITQRN